MTTNACGRKQSQTDRRVTFSRLPFTGVNLCRCMMKHFNADDMNAHTVITTYFPCRWTLQRIPKCNTFPYPQPISGSSIRDSKTNMRLFADTRQRISDIQPEYMSSPLHNKCCISITGTGLPSGCLVSLALVRSHRDNRDCTPLCRLVPSLRISRAPNVLVACTEIPYHYLLLLRLQTLLRYFVISPPI